MLKSILNYWASWSRIEVITGHGADTPYLVRSHLINNRWFKLYLHRFLRSDLEDFHDHPWSSVSLGISGTYVEEIYDWRTRTFQTLHRKAGRLIYRPATLLHRIKVGREYDLSKGRDWLNAPTTLFFAFTKTQEWGFVRDYATAPRWVHWSEYVVEEQKRGAGGFRK